MRGHDWVAATVMRLDDHHAAQAARNEYLMIVSRVRVEVMDVYCKTCRRPFNPSTQREPCRIGPQHIGGPRRQPELEEIPDPWA